MVTSNVFFYIPLHALHQGANIFKMINLSLLISSNVLQKEETRREKKNVAT